MTRHQPRLCRPPISVWVRDCESDSEDKMEVHPLVPPVSPVVPSPGASDGDSTDEVEIRWDLPVTAVPHVPPAAQQAGQPLIGDEQPAQAVDHQSTAPATGRPVRAAWNALPRYASAAVPNPVFGGQGSRSKPKCRLRIPEPRLTTRHGLVDGDNAKKTGCKGTAAKTM
jgi:hypothetical protein